MSSLGLSIISFTQFFFFSAFATMSPPPARRAVDRLRLSMSTCAVVAAQYGQCVTASYQNIHKDACAKEFSLFRECIRQALKQ
jgi:hypothetical protein